MKQMEDTEVRAKKKSSLLEGKKGHRMVTPWRGNLDGPDILIMKHLVDSLALASVTLAKRPSRC